MALTNYQKGRDKEYRLKRKLEREGFTVLRTAGSHGFADLIAIDYRSRRIRFIQVKPDNFSKAAEKKLMEEHKEFKYNPVFVTSYEVL